MSEAAKPEPEPWARPRSEPFEVVLCKTGVELLGAKTEDFKRVGVTAASPTEAMQDPACVVEGYDVVQAVNPSNLTEYERMARDRESRESMGGSWDPKKY